MSKAVRGGNARAEITSGRSAGSPLRVAHTQSKTRCPKCRESDAREFGLALKCACGYMWLQATTY
jgi:predicted RNA-binding Zn-ribbon protein involved in translation (DUF1610 family)